MRFGQDPKSAMSPVAGHLSLHVAQCAPPGSTLRTVHLAQNLDFVVVAAAYVSTLRAYTRERQFLTLRPPAHKPICHPEPSPDRYHSMAKHWHFTDNAACIGQARGCVSVAILVTFSGNHEHRNNSRLMHRPAIEPRPVSAESDHLRHLSNVPEIMKRPRVHHLHRMAEPLGHNNGMCDSALLRVKFD